MLSQRLVSGAPRGANARISGPGRASFAAFNAMETLRRLSSKLSGRGGEAPAPAAPPPAAEPTRPPLSVEVAKPEVGLCINYKLPDES